MSKILIDENSTAVVNGRVYAGKKVSKEARKAIAEQEKKFQQHKKDIALCHEYHQLKQSLVYAKLNRNVALITQLNWKIMSVLLQYTLRRGLYSTNVAIYEMDAFTRGMSQ